MTLLAAIFTVILFFTFHHVHAAITSLTIIDASANKPLTKIISSTNYPRNTLPTSLSIRADVSNPSLISNIQFIDDITNKLIRKEGVAPYAINGDKNGNYNAWNAPIGSIRLRVVETLKAGGVNVLIVPFTISAGDGDGTVTLTPTPTPTSTGTIKATFVNAATDADFGEITNGAKFSRTTLPSSLTIRADIVKTGTSKNSVKFYVNGVSIRQENVAPYMIAGDAGSKVFPWNGLPNGPVTLKLEQIVNGAIVKSVTLSFTVEAGSTVTVTPTPVPLAAKWKNLNTIGGPNKRHEACFVMGNDGKGYLLGGRGVKPVDVYDPATNTWSRKPGPGIELHHMQCLAYDNKIWIGSSWTGGFPKEKNTELMYIYDIVTDEWSTKPGLPEPRRRGGGAFVLHQGKMWLAMGNRGGHGAHATSFGWLDMFDPKADGGKGAWSPVKYPDAPDARDHTSGAIVKGNMLCVGGGRDGGSGNFFNNPVLPVNCYDFATNKWERGPNIPQGRAGAAAGTTCDGEMMIAGGEGFGQAFNDVSIFDGKSWRVGPPLGRARHGSGLAISKDCKCKKIYIASGSGNQGGGPELTSTEVYLDKGDATPTCAA